MNLAKFVDEVVALGTSGSFSMAPILRAVAKDSRAFDEKLGLQHLLQAVQLFKAAPIGNNLVLNYVAQNALGLPKGY
jgi:hypothetical protein